MQTLGHVYNTLITEPGVPAPRQLGNSQVFEFGPRSSPFFLLAIRDAGRKPGYSNPDRLWIEGLDPVMQRYIELLAGSEDFDTLPPAGCLVIDNPENALVVVQLRDLAAQHRRGLLEHPTDARFTFMLHRRNMDYVVEGAYGTPDVPVKPLRSLRELASLTGC